MAKTIMVSNRIYGELKTAKGRESFSELLTNLLHSTGKTGNSLKDCLGLLKSDREYDKIFRKLGKEWRSWTQRYA